MLVFDSVISVASILRVHIPSEVPSPEILETANLGHYLPAKQIEDTASITVFQNSDTAIVRALSQVLALVNDTPVSSEKYEFARSLAGKIIHQNMVQGDVTSRGANKVALSAGFSRTLQLLTLALQGMQQQQQHKQQEEKGSSWLWSISGLIFSRGFSMFPPLFSLENVRICISNFLVSLLQTSSSSLEVSPPMPIASIESARTCLPAEKLAQELLWMTEKLKECSAINVAIMTWSTVPGLASLSLYAPPRVQASLLRVSVLLLKDMACEVEKSTRSLKMNLLLSWLPLFCCAKSGYDCPIFTPAEKVEILDLLEKNILSLTDSEQEMVLACWLKEYVSSSSEWPNLQLCFETWCHPSRKTTKISDE